MYLISKTSNYYFNQKKKKKKKIDCLKISNCPDLLNISLEEERIDSFYKFTQYILSLKDVVHLNYWWNFLVFFNQRMLVYLDNVMAAARFRVISRTVSLYVLSTRYYLLSVFLVISFYFLMAPCSWRGSPVLMNAADDVEIVGPCRWSADRLFSSKSGIQSRATFGHGRNEIERN